MATGLAAPGMVRRADSALLSAAYALLRRRFCNEAFLNHNCAPYATPPGQRMAKTSPAKQAPEPVQAAPEVAPQPVTHTYADGSSVVGQPPFPKESPIERKAALVRQAQAPAVVTTDPELPRAAAKDNAAVDGDEAA